MDQRGGVCYFFGMPYDDKPSLAEEYPIGETLTLAADAFTETMLGTTVGIGFKLAATVMSKINERRANRMYADILASWARAAEASPAEYKDIMFERAQDDEAFQERIADTYKSMIAAKSPRLFPYVAMLTAPYAIQGLAPDAFYKRTAFLIERLEDGDLDILQATLRTSAAVLSLAPPPTPESGITNRRGVVWDYHPGAGIVVNTYDQVLQRNVTHDQPEAQRAEQFQVLELVSQSRLGTGQGPSRVEFPYTSDHLTRLIRLFLAP